MNPLYIVTTLVVYFLILLVVSRLTSRGADNDSFYRGNRSSPWYLVSFGMIGASLSGVTFVSVPGMVRGIDMTYLQMCMGFFFGYLFIACVLLPVYYRLNLTSIYTYLGRRLGPCSYKTGSLFFFISKMLGAAIRLYLVCLILQQFVFSHLSVPFPLTVVVIVTLIWLYTRRGGIRTIVWTDAFQTFCLIAALVMILIRVCGAVGVHDLASLSSVVEGSGMSRVFVFDDWHSRQNFFKQFFSGVFITIVMTGLDQDMMQKNLSCRNLREARTNMCTYGMCFLPVNFLFLVLGVLLVVCAPQVGLVLPQSGDQILPTYAAGGYLGPVVLVLFTIGIIAAAFSSADSALTALTTSFCVDLLGNERLERGRAERQRKWVHFFITVVFVACILVFYAIGNDCVIDALYVMASYTYGPLLGLFAFGLFTHRAVRDSFVPVVALLSPLVCYLIDRAVWSATGYSFGYEMLMFNGLLTFSGLWITGRGDN